MSRIVINATALMGTYLLVLTSLAPGDLLVGGTLGLCVAVALRPQGRSGGSGPSPAQFRATAGVLTQTAAEMARGSWRVARFCLGAPASSGLVEIPREGRSRVNVAVWGVLTGEAPDEVVVDIDEDRDVLIVHLVEAGDPDAVRARHRQNYERWQRKAVR